MGKPVVFNYSDHEKLKAAYDEQVERNKELMEDVRRLRSKVSDLSIRGRIAETDLEEEKKRNERTHDADRPTGKWIIVTDNRGQHAECPYCGEWRYHSNQKFCGECGVRMEEKDE